MTASAMAGAIRYTEHVTTTTPKDGRRQTPEPLAIRTQGIDVSRETRAHVKKRLAFKLGKLARAIERISVRLEDVNGPRGGVDKQCRIKVVLRGMQSVVVQHADHDVLAAIDGAASRAERAAKRSVKKRADARARARPRAR
jgi:ribosome-associated translation inhibitor RaiA